MGRPKKKTEELRLFNVMIALNKFEKEKLKKLVALRENNASVVIRELIMKQSITVNQINRIDVATHLLTRRISNNFNQYVRAIHQSEITKVELNVLKEIKALLDIIHRKIFHP